MSRNNIKDYKFLGRDIPPEPLEIVDSMGNYLIDFRGKKYLDFFMGWCVGNLGATNNLFDSKKIKNSIKLAGIKNTLKKLKTLISVILKNKSKNEKIVFESSNLIIVVSNRIVDNFDEMCNYEMLKRFDFGNMKVAIFQK